MQVNVNCGAFKYGHFVPINCKLILLLHMPSFSSFFRVFSGTCIKEPS
jgi:hypothetical protein